MTKPLKALFRKLNDSEHAMLRTLTFRWRAHSQSIHPDSPDTMLARDRFALEQQRIFRNDPHVADLVREKLRAFDAHCRSTWEHSLAITSHIEAIQFKAKDVHVQYFHQGNFTVALVRDPAEFTMRIGIAKRAASLDDYSRIAGQARALRRAFMNPDVTMCMPMDEVLELHLSCPPAEQSEQKAAGAGVQ